MDAASKKEKEIKKAPASATNKAAKEVIGNWRTGDFGESKPVAMTPRGENTGGGGGGGKKKKNKVSEPGPSIMDALPQERPKT